MSPFSLVADEDGVDELAFRLPVGGETVPGLLWRPSGSAGPRPAVLIGHGRTACKRSPYLLNLARRLVSRRGWAAAALDAPAHGERRPPGAEDWPRPDPDQAVAEWRACIDFLQDEAPFDGALGYWGLSMGTAVGVPLLAAEPRLRAAVIGLMHARSPRVRADAARVACPVLFIANWDDSRAPRAEAFELFDTIGTADKRLHAYPGEHAAIPDEAITASEDFLARHLDSPQVGSH